MSFVFDAAERAFAMMADDITDDVLKTRFALLLSAMHEANHKIGDKINHDPQVRRQAEAIEKHLAERAKKTT